MTYRIAWLILLFLSFFLPLSAQITYVTENGTGNGSSWNQATDNLYDVLENASSGDQIWVAAGTYRPTSCNNCQQADRNQRFNIPDKVAIYGGFAGTETQLNERNWEINETILSGDIDEDDTPDDNSYTIVYFENVDSTTTIDGFTIRDGNAISEISGAEGPGRSGAGIFNMGSVASSPTIRHCRFIDHFADAHGAAIFNNGRNGGQANATISDCSFTGNHAIRSGGAIFNDSGDNQGESSPLIVNCYFEDNSSIFGGAMYNSGFGGVAAPFIIGCTFIDNNASSIAGGCYNFSKDDGLVQPTFINCIFAENYGKSCGGIYSLSNGGSAKPNIINCVFYKNEANTGGAVYCNESDEGDTEVFIYNTIFYENIANHNPIFHMSGDGSPTMNLFNSMLHAADCESVAQLGETDSLFCGSGIIYNQDPLFVDAPNYDFHLDPASPAVDGGDNQIVLNNQIFFDLDSLPRIHNMLVDMGPLEENTIGYIPTTISTQPVSQSNCQYEDISLFIETQGTQPAEYQWFKDGQVVAGANQSELDFQDVNLSDQGSYYIEILTVTGDQVISDTAVIEVTELQDPYIEITSTTEEICGGTAVTFSVVDIENQGSNPDFQWQRNGANVGTNQPIYSTQSLMDGDIVRCILDASAECLTGNTTFSNEITIAVTPTVTPTISIAADDIEICENTPVTFTAQISGGGADPQINWLRNGVVIDQNTTNITINDIDSDDIIRARIISSAECASSQPVFSESISISVMALLDLGVEISTSQQSSCEGSSVTFIADAENGGNNTSYQWMINGQPSGNDSATFITSDLEDGDQVTCEVASTEDCLTNNSAVADPVIMIVNEIVVPEISIVSDKEEICDSESATFTAQITNGGTSPIIQWYSNGTETGTDDISIILNNLNSDDLITARVISSAICADTEPVISEGLSINIISSEPLIINIEADQESTCEGEFITFTADAENEGNTTTYQWLVNNQPVGTNAPTFITDNLNDEDEVTCQLTSDGACLTNNTATADPVTVGIIESVMPAIIITGNTAQACENEEVTFIAEITNGGANPDIQWYLNNFETGTNDLSLTLNGLNSNDVVTAHLISSADCATTEPIFSDEISVTINMLQALSISVTSNQSAVCDGEEVTFTAIAENEGNNATYQWMINNQPAGSNAPTFSTNDLEDQDKITCQVTSADNCLINDTATSEEIVVDILNEVNPSITVMSDVNQICENEVVTFTTTITNGGTNPSIQWFINGMETVNDEMTLSIDTLSSQDIITAHVISSASCAPAEPELSEGITVSVTEMQQLTVDITANQSSICAGDTVIFSAITENEGINPVYQWKINGVGVTGNGPVYETSSLEVDANITCTVTSDATCIENETVTSAAYSLNVDPVLNPEISISMAQDSACIGDTLTFLATITDQGINPEIIWMINDVETGATGEFYTTHDLQPDDQITAMLSVPDQCATQSEVIATGILIDFSDCQTVSSKTVEDNRSLQVFPNPASDYFNIQFDNYYGLTNIYIYDIHGKSIINRQIQINQSDFTIKINSRDFIEGTYIIYLFNEDKYSVSRILVN